MIINTYKKKRKKIHFVRNLEEALDNLISSISLVFEIKKKNNEKKVFAMDLEDKIKKIKSNHEILKKIIEKQFPSNNKNKKLYLILNKQIEYPLKRFQDSNYKEMHDLLIPDLKKNVLEYNMKIESKILLYYIREDLSKIIDLIYKIIISKKIQNKKKTLIKLISRIIKCIEENYLIMYRKYEKELSNSNFKEPTYILIDEFCEIIENNLGNELNGEKKEKLSNLRNKIFKELEIL